MSVTPVEGEEPDREMKFKFCWMKGKAIDVFTGTLTEGKGANSTTAENPVVWALLYMQRMGVIQSAYDVYMGIEPLKIDSSIFETAVELAQKLRIACGLQKTANLEIMKLVKKKVITEEEWENGDNDEESPKSLCTVVAALDKEDKKIPYWTALLRSTVQRSTRFDFASGTWKDTALSVGYLPSKSHRFGPTGCRGYYRMNSRHNNHQGIDKESHLNQHMGHSSNVALAHYERHDDYRAMIPANIFQHNVTKEQVERVIAAIEYTPVSLSSSATSRLTSRLCSHSPFLSVIGI
jgi:hypothetical protein